MTDKEKTMIEKIYEKYEPSFQVAFDIIHTGYMESELLSADEATKKTLGFFKDMYSKKIFSTISPESVEIQKKYLEIQGKFFKDRTAGITNVDSLLNTVRDDFKELVEFHEQVRKSPKVNNEQIFVKCVGEKLFTDSILFPNLKKFIEKKEAEKTSDITESGIHISKETAKQVKPSTSKSHAEKAVESKKSKPTEVEF